MKRLRVEGGKFNSVGFGFRRRKEEAKRRRISDIYIKVKTRQRCR